MSPVKNKAGKYDFPPKKTSKVLRVILTDLGQKV